MQPVRITWKYLCTAVELSNMTHLQEIVCWLEMEKSAEKVWCFLFWSELCEEKGISSFRQNNARMASFCDRKKHLADGEYLLRTFRFWYFFHSGLSANCMRHATCSFTSNCLNNWEVISAPIRQNLITSGFRTSSPNYSIGVVSVVCLARNVSSQNWLEDLEVISSMNVCFFGDAASI